MDLGDLARRVAEDRRSGLAPVMVVGTAGTTAAGAIDPLPELARFCRSQKLWFHVDAAWGGAAILSPRLRGHLAGIDAADSITCDAHKWFSVPMGAGMFFCRHPDVVGEAFRAQTSYMPGKTDGPVVDPYTTSVQWSRRFIGLKLFLALAQHGESGYVEMIEHQARMGDVLRESVRARGLAHRQPHAPAARVLHPGWPRRQQIPRRPLRASDRLDVGSPPGRRRAGGARVCHEFPDHASPTSSGSCAR